MLNYGYVQDQPLLNELIQEFNSLGDHKLILFRPWSKISNPFEGLA